MRIAEIARRPAPILLLVLVATVAALYPASRLHIRADILSLLPQGSPAADDYRVFLERFGGLEQVFVVILPAPPDRRTGAAADAADLADAAGRLAEILAASPEVAHARAGIEERDEDFFVRWVAPRAPLLIGGDWLGTVGRRIEPAAISRRVARLRSVLSSPAGAAEALVARSDPLGFAEELSLAPAGALDVDPLTSTFRSRNGGAALVILTPARSEIDPQGGRDLVAALDTAYAEVRRELPVGLEFHALGGPLYAAHDETSLRGDLRRTLTASLLTTTALLLAAFGGWRMPLTIVAPLLAGLLWTAALTGLWRGGVSAVSIGFGAVLVGLGIDYGIHGATRFRQAYLAGPDAAGAFATTVRDVGPPILTSAATTAAGFAVLGFAHLPPLRELGLLVALGILAILAAMATAGGAAWVLVAPRLEPPGRLWRWLGDAGDLLPAFATRHPRWVLTAAAAATLAAIGTVSGLTVDPDVRTLRPDDHPAHLAEELLAEHFDVGLDTTTVVVRGDDLPAALAATAAAAAELRGELPDASLSSPADLLTCGPAQAERLRRLAALPLERAAADLERELAAANLDPRAFTRGLEALRAFGRGEDPGAPPDDAWPEWISRSLIRDDGGVWAALRLRLPPGTWPDGPPPALIERVRTLAPGAAFASAVAIGSELRSLAVGDLRTLSLLALAAVAAVVIVSFRGRLGASALAGLPVILGSLWTLALWAALGRALDLFTLAVLPILLGIGIDDGLHVVHGAGADPAAGIRGAVSTSGRALILTTLTTCAGFGSLVFSSIPGLQNGGALIAVGVVTCLLTTLLVLPAIEAARRTTSPAAGARSAVPPPHAPEFGRTGLLLGRFHVTGVFWFRFHRWGVSKLPPWCIWLFTVLFTTLFFVALRRIGKAIAANLDAVLGDCGWWRRQQRIYRTMWNFAWCLSERYERLSTERRVAANPTLGEEHWRRALADPEGLILVTAHVGHWEVGSMMVPERHVHVVREEEVDPRSQQFTLELFEEQTAASFTMHFARADPTLGLQLLKALRRGELVALQGDRPRTSGRTCRVELFGRPLDLPAGPAVLARAAGVALMPVFVFRCGRHRSQIVFRPPIRVGEGETGIAEAMRRIAAEVEWAIRHQPHQWFCFRDLWGAR